jgi:hypothetical protein
MLSQEHHGRIIADIDNIARRANIPKSFLNRSAKEFCKGTELEWLKKFPANQRAGNGLVLLGTHEPAPDVKMMAMAAALIRNYVDAKVLTIQTLLDAQQRDLEVPDPTVMFVPNLFVRQGGQGLPAWKMQIVYDVLLSRFTNGRLSAVYVEDMAALGSTYGHLLVQHLESNYLVSQG